MKHWNTLKPGESFVAFFLIRRVESKTTSGGKSYLDIVMGDAVGEITARLWDSKQEDALRFTNNILVKVKGSIVEWQGKKQVKIDKIREAADTDGVSIQDFVPTAPHSPQDMYAELLAYMSRIENDKLRETVALLIEEAGESLLIHPAALQNHHALRSGLLYHTVTMLKAGEKLAQVYSFLDTDLLFAGTILHDLAKLDEIKANEIGIATEYSCQGQLLGHLVQGILKIEKAARTVGLDEETTLLLEHMLLSHHYEPEFGSPKRPMFPEAEILHYLDIMDARMFDMQKALSETEKGCFTDKLWTLDNRRLYKR
ncbi:HD domain-containing protein [Dehalobacter sp. DCM]|uniref:3'-5' exoribonuclease YhaM family protein n=1 Tax=Dehalobacter sp. DCM TaxID=2907827 RepID=UPI0030813F8C|nr:HD domain-containing protein [Dehalobacter sp. DCM]